MQNICNVMSEHKLWSLLFVNSGHICLHCSITANLHCAAYCWHCILLTLRSWTNGSLVCCCHLWSIMSTWDEINNECCLEFLTYLVFLDHCWLVLSSQFVEQVPLLLPSEQSCVKALTWNTKLLLGPLFCAHGISHCASDCYFLPWNSVEVTEYQVSHAHLTQYTVHTTVWHLTHWC